MATHRIPILGPGTVPDTSGEVFFQPYSVVDAGAVIDPLVLTFNDSGTKDGVRGSFRVPENYVGTAKLLVVWTANATSGTFVVDWSVLTRSGAEDMGAAATRTTETVTDTKTGTAFAREEASLTLTDADYAAGDEVLFEMFRDTVTDTMAAPAVVFGVYFEYADA
jgi:hypothetical protein